MKLSIWQQFSSNHSNDFTVVGKFISAEEAQKAAAELHHALLEVANWEGIWRYDEWGEVSPIEIEIGKRYGFEWQTHHDWIKYQYGEDAIDRALTAFENYILMSSPFQLYTGHKPFDEFIEKLGGEVIAWSEIPDGTYLVVNLTCQISNQEIGLKLHDAVNTYFESQKRGDSFVAIPWAAYIGAKRHSQAEEIVRIHCLKMAWLQAEINYEQENRHLHNEISEQIKAILEPPGLPRIEFHHSSAAMALHNEYLQSRELAISKIPKITEEEDLLLSSLDILSLAADPNRDGAGIEQAGTVLHFKNIEFWKINHGLPALIAWLKDNGCTDIHYSIEKKNL